MLELLYSFFIFCIVLFFYLHIYYHLKTSDDLEIYEIEQATKDKMEEICDLRQPVLFHLENEQWKIVETTNKNAILANYPSFEVKVRENIYNFFDEDFDMYIPLSLVLTNKLVEQDTSKNYYSENNSDFLEETGLKKYIQQYDKQLRPSFVCNCNYDILLGSEGCITPFRYNFNYRNYYIVTQGSLRIKLAPPKSSKYLYPISDYEVFEFRSPLNPWQIQERYASDFEKVKCLDITLEPGTCFYIPAYWWYSFEFGKNTSVTCLQYRTYMNNITILPHVVMYALQNQNVKHKTMKQLHFANTNTNTNTNKPKKEKSNKKQSNNDNTQSITQQVEIGTTDLDTLPTEQNTVIDL